MTAPAPEMTVGSSPHTRGAPEDGLDLAVPIGIIPAYAGSTLSLTVRCALDEDHPRIRGEHSQAGNGGVRLAGSSPHTRGALEGLDLGADYMGIIPAYAGSTTRPSRARKTFSDHPRIRGEHVQMNRAIADGSGSSPHTRGALACLKSSRNGRWIIPAYAGSTDMHGGHA